MRPDSICDDVGTSFSRIFPPFFIFLIYPFVILNYFLFIPSMSNPRLFTQIQNKKDETESRDVKN